jgi:hypothetical protein|mmetsp:Transcript_46516/g.73521  ORF Transcript_46516/g.73521 Transcript_46516/m.73521 type:complete len:241 (-) Transcript_46516:78-800(-)
MLACDKDVCDGALDDMVSDCSTYDAKIVDDLRSDCSSDHGDVNTLIIFDWDDTLFPTSWTFTKGLLDDSAMPSEKNSELFLKLAVTIERVLKSASQLGKVVIVTNAQQGWVEMCCSKLLPSLLSVLRSVDIVSARFCHEQESDDPTEWKRLEFLKQVELIHGSNNQHLNLISVGDSSHERQALVSACASVQSSSGKSLKFAECPTIERLLDQLDLVNTSIVDVAEHNGHLDIEIGSDDSP